LGGDNSRTSAFASFIFSVCKSTPFGNESLIAEAGTAKPVPKLQPGKRLRKRHLRNLLILFLLLDRTFHVTLGKDDILLREIQFDFPGNQNGGRLLANPIHSHLEGSVQLVFHLSDIFKYGCFDMAVIVVIKLDFLLEIMALVHPR